MSFQSSDHFEWSDDLFFYFMTQRVSSNAWYDVHIGPHNLLTLPDLRGEYEDKCFTAWRNVQNENVVSLTTPVKPFLSSDQVEDFIKQVETYKIYDYYRAYNAWSNKNEKMEPLESELKIL